MITLIVKITAACMLESMYMLQAKLQTACKIQAQLQDTLQALQARACFLTHSTRHLSIETAFFHTLHVHC